MKPLLTLCMIPLLAYSTQGAALSLAPEEFTASRKLACVLAQQSLGQLSEEEYGNRAHTLLDDFDEDERDNILAQAIGYYGGLMFSTADRDAAQAELKLAPHPMTEVREAVATFAEHNQIIETQRNGKPLGLLTTGIKKDVVLTPRIFEKPNRLAIYGWRQLDGKPIQPLTIVHWNQYVDYSHGVRLVRNDIDGGEKLTKDANAPVRALLMGPSGELFVRKEIDDKPEVDYHKLIFSDDKRKPGQIPGMGPEGAMEMMPGGPGGRGRRSER